MKKIYLVTTKTFYTDDQGVEHQLEDYGYLPALFPSYEKAHDCMERTKKMRFEIFNEELKEESPKGREGSPLLIEEFVTISPVSNIRNVFSLWYNWLT